MPVTDGMRWSTRNSATGSPRWVSSRTTSSASRRGARADDPVVVGVPRAQIALDGAQDGRVVIDREDCRLGGHAASVPAVRRYAASMWVRA